MNLHNILQNIVCVALLTVSAHAMNQPTDQDSPIPDLKTFAEKVYDSNSRAIRSNFQIGKCNVTIDDKSSVTDPILKTLKKNENFDEWMRWTTYSGLGSDTKYRNFVDVRLAAAQPQFFDYQVAALGSGKWQIDLVVKSHKGKQGIELASKMDLDKYFKATLIDPVHFIFVLTAPGFGTEPTSAPKSAPTSAPNPAPVPPAAPAEGATKTEALDGGDPSIFFNYTFIGGRWIRGGRV